jgi:hypothetical protein
MKTVSIKQEAQKIINDLPENSTWEDLMYEFYVRESIDAGLKDSKQGRTFSVAEVRRKYGLEK